mmetsp:Transcript_10650/g.16861  ORF Transcript_10650/g.16861 Transcript_10650/m.16861 type:complete len:211 (-) Transcript_10650:389-1021(-)
MIGPKPYPTSSEAPTILERKYVAGRANASGTRAEKLSVRFLKKKSQGSTPYRVPPFSPSSIRLLYTAILTGARTVRPYSAESTATRQPAMVAREMTPVTMQNITPRLRSISKPMPAPTSTQNGHPTNDASPIAKIAIISLLEYHATKLNVTISLAKVCGRKLAPELNNPADTARQRVVALETPGPNRVATLDAKAASATADSTPNIPRMA